MTTTTTRETSGRAPSVPATMRAVVMRQFGGPEVMRMEDVPVPAPGAGEVLLRVGAVSINRSFDIKVRQDGNGRGVTLPLVLGADPSGEIVAVGSDVKEYAVGDRVTVWRAQSCGTCQRCESGDEVNCQRKVTLGVHRWGGCAEYVSVPTGMLHPVPPGVSYAEASVIMRHFPTALALAFDRAVMQAGESVLVMGAAGGLGSALVQIARHAGARVLAGAGSDERVAAALDLGAHAGVNYRRQDLAQEARRFTDGQGVDLVFENIGDPTLFPGALESLAYGGRMATIGAHGGGVVPLDARRLYGLRLSILGGAGALPAHARQALEGAAAGVYRAAIGAIMPLDQTSHAHAALEAGQIVGKVILDPNGVAREPAA